MTRKEAIEVLQASSIKQMSLTKVVVDDKFLSVKEALDMAIKSLEQEPTDNDIVLTYDMYHDLIADRAEKLEQESVIDKIRAEIIQVVAEESSEDSRWVLGLKYAIKIIDKYNTESEEEYESN